MCADTNKKLVKAVVFDLDGTLVDSETVMQEQVDEFLHRHWGVTAWTSKDHSQVRVNYRKDWVAAYVYPKLHSVSPNVSEEEFLRLWERERLERQKEYGTRVKVFPGATNLVSQFRGSSVFMAVGTSRWLSQVESLVSHNSTFAEIFHSTRACVTGDTVTHCKPDPETFLKAAELVGVAPENCLVFENSVSGIKAAKAGGMACVGISSYPGVQLDGYGAEVLVNSIEEVTKELLEKYFDFQGLQSQETNSSLAVSGSFEVEEGTHQSLHIKINKHVTSLNCNGLKSLISEKKPTCSRAMYIHVPETLVSFIIPTIYEFGFKFYRYLDGILSYYVWCDLDIEDKVPEFATSIGGAQVILLSPDEEKILFVHEYGKWKGITGGVPKGTTSFSQAIQEVFKKKSLWASLVFCFLYI
jgi:beta-phosphoglucomutase-like phosphatase (HAD superfamily)